MPHNAPLAPAVLGDVAYLHPLNPLIEQRLEVRLLEGNLEHVKVQSAAYVLPGSLVQIHLETGYFMGEIEYCLANQGTFELGVDLQHFFFIRAGSEARRPSESYGASRWGT
jgi:hypothetical protein